MLQVNISLASTRSRMYWVIRSNFNALPDITGSAFSRGARRLDLDPSQLHSNEIRTPLCSIMEQLRPEAFAL